MRQGAFTYSSRIRLGKGLVASWSKVSSFLTLVTDNPSPFRVAAELLEGHDVPAAFFQEQMTHFTGRYEHYGSNPLGDYTFHQWLIPNENVVAEIERIERYRPLPKTEFGPLTLNIRTEFSLLDQSGSVLPYQSQSDYRFFVSRDKKAEALGNSRIDAYLSENSSMSMFLTVPFESDDHRLENYIDFICRSAKFKLNRKMWKRWRITKSGSGYTKRGWAP